MAQLWGGRFTKDTDELVYRFNASISFDSKFLGQDIEGSIAHVVMLHKQGILKTEEKDAIVKGLTGIREDVENGKLEITEEYEDIHPKRNYQYGRAVKGTAYNASLGYGRKHGDLYAGLYPFTKSPAGYISPSYGSIL